MFDNRIGVVMPFDKAKTERRLRKCYDHQIVSLSATFNE
jgi:hypothetical protein